jgi:hypothetical protein
VEAGVGGVSVAGGVGEEEVGGGVGEEDARGVGEEEVARRVGEEEVGGGEEASWEVVEGGRRWAEGEDDVGGRSCSEDADRTSEKPNREIREIKFFTPLSDSEGGVSEEGGVAEA